MNAGTAVAVMLAQMQDEIAARNLTVKRGGRVEAMIPIDREAKEPQVELICLLYIEYAQNGDDQTKLISITAFPRKIVRGALRPL